MMTMRLSDLIAATTARLAHRSDEARVGSIAVAGVTEDSRRVQPGDVFVAVRGGKTDGWRFVPRAVEQGAVAVLSDRVEPNAPASLVQLIAPEPRQALAEISAALYGRPADSLQLLGVTGTNGKTTTTYLIHGLLTALGDRCGRLGTVTNDLGAGEPEEATYTTPPATELHRLFAAMRDNGCRHASLEVSSQALDQHRAHGLRFRGAIFTNLTQDHLDYHGSMATYAAAKARLFEQVDEAGVCILNGDDPYVGTMIAVSRARVLTFGLEPHNVYQAVGIEQTAAGTRFAVKHPDGVTIVRSPMVGLYNVRNLLGAFSLAHGLGYDAGAIGPALGTLIGAPGRLERVEPADPEAAATVPHVWVDYAHTPDALEQAIRALRAVAPDQPLTVVVGCGGDRDATKRPIMGRIAAELADRAVFTSDNPRSEDPFAILEDVAADVPAERRDRVTSIEDRAAAIQDAIGRSAANGLVLVAGKGHETYQIVGSETREFDDRIVARDALNARLGSTAGTPSAAA